MPSFLPLSLFHPPPFLFAHFLFRSLSLFFLAPLSWCSLYGRSRVKASQQPGTSMSFSFLFKPFRVPRRVLSQPTPLWPYRFSMQRAVLNLRRSKYFDFPLRASSLISTRVASMRKLVDELFTRTQWF